MVFALAVADRRDREDAHRRDAAVHAKLDEILRALAGARDELVRVEDEPLEQIERLRP
jgi:low affinity Fe/Cu permease